MPYVAPFIRDAVDLGLKVPVANLSFVGSENAKLMIEVLHRLGGNPERSKFESAVFTVKDFDLGIGERVRDRRVGLVTVVIGFDDDLAAAHTADPVNMGEGMPLVDFDEGQKMYGMESYGRSG